MLGKVCLYPQNSSFLPSFPPHHQNVSHLGLIGPAHFLLHLNPSLFGSAHLVCSPAVWRDLFAVVFMRICFVLPPSSSIKVPLSCLTRCSFASPQTLLSRLQGFDAARCISTFSSGVSTQLVPIQLLVLIFFFFFFSKWV